ncbi:MAG: hypothetical protein R8J85_07355 [Mariprofundales bacterium]
MIRHPIYLLIITLLLSACGTVGSNINQAASQSSIGFLHTYSIALKRFKSGHIMEARNHILRMDKSRKHYHKALRLLKTKIEPARRRLLKHYSRAAAKAEKRHKWTKARNLYREAASFSLSNKRLTKKMQRMDLHMRQLRMDTLIKQLRREDRALLSWLYAYTPPNGLNAKEMPFIRQAKHRQAWVEDIAAQAYREARRYLLRGYAEVAYAEIESHLRLEPESSKGAKLRARIMAELPKGLKLPHRMRFKRHAASAHTIGTVNANQIKQLIKNGKLLQAKRYALHYRHQDGKGADALFKTVQAHIRKVAAISFEQGRQSFRKEQLTAAVRHWHRATQLMPNNTEYRESLLRAEQMLERLKILSRHP